MTITQITPQEAYDMLEKDPSAVYIDVRTVLEFVAGHPRGGVNIPLVFFDLATRQPVPNPKFFAVVEANFPRDKRIIVGCSAGERSQRAAEILAQEGYTNLANMQGGFGGTRDQTGRTVTPGWRELGLPVSTDSGEGASYESLAAEAEKT